MDDAFELRLGAAVRAGWRALAVGLGIVTVAWLAFMAFARSRPAWCLALWGPDATWTEAAHLWLWSLAVLKLALYLLGLIVTWATFWHSQLRKARSAQRQTE